MQGKDNILIALAGNKVDLEDQRQVDPAVGAGVALCDRSKLQRVGRRYRYSLIPRLLYR